MVQCRLGRPLLALDGEPGLVESAGGEVFSADEPVQGALVAPGRPRVAVGAELGEQGRRGCPPVRTAPGPLPRSRGRRRRRRRPRPPGRRRRRRAGSRPGGTVPRGRPGAVRHTAPRRRRTRARAPATRARRPRPEALESPEDGHDLLVRFGSPQACAQAQDRCPALGDRYVVSLSTSRAGGAMDAPSSDCARAREPPDQSAGNRRPPVGSREARRVLPSATAGPGRGNLTRGWLGSRTHTMHLNRPQQQSTAENRQYPHPGSRRTGLAFRWQLMPVVRRQTSTRSAVSLRGVSPSRVRSRAAGSGTPCSTGGGVCDRVPTRKASPALAQKACTTPGSAEYGSAYGSVSGARRRLSARAPASTVSKPSRLISSAALAVASGSCRRWAGRGGRRRLWGGRG